MKVSIYRGSASNEYETLYLFVRKGTDTSRLPQEVKAELGELKFEKELDIMPWEQRIALNTEEAINNIKSQGYHIQKTRFEIRITPPRGEHLLNRERSVPAEDAG